MPTETLLQYAPKPLVIFAGLALVYAIRRYNRKNDGAAWLRHIYACAEKATKNEQYRQSELADANEKIAQYPETDPIEPISLKMRTRINGFPKMLFMAGLTGAVFIYLGLFETGPSGTIWPVYAGAGFLILALALYRATENMRPRIRRVQQLNRKYLLQKAGKDAERFETLKEIIEYYPEVGELRLELGDQYAVVNKLDEAVREVKKARKLSPENIDMALVETSFQLRRGDADGAEKALDNAEALKKIATDPRIALYRAAIALRKKDRETAARSGEEAKDLDRNFTEHLLEKDPGLKDLADFFQREP